MIGMDIKLAIASLRAAKVRAFMTMFAVVVGVMLFVVVSAAIEGLKASAVQQINDLGGNLVQVNSGKIITEDEDGSTTVNPLAGFGGTPTISERDYNEIVELDGIKAAAPQFILDIAGVVKRGEDSLTNTFILATNDDYPEALGQQIDEGEFYIEEGFAVIGQKVKEELFEGGNALGSQITIRGENFIVRGVMENYEMSFSFGSLDINRTVLIGLDSGKKLSGLPVGITEIDIQLEDGTDVEAFVSSVEAILYANHGVEEGEEDFTVLTQEDLIELTEELLGIIDTVAKFMPYILLFVGAVVILLIMRITVTERIREIGIRKSIGATNGNVLTQFLAEAVVISVVGSLLGIVLAFIIGLIVVWLADFTFVYNLNTLVAVVLIGSIIGALAGLFPAWEAARKDPVEALRHE